MVKFVAVILCSDEVQLVIPENWFSPEGLDCNGYNEGVNRNKKRRIFYSPFGDDIEADFGLPIQNEFQSQANACYAARFVKAFCSKEDCLGYIERRRCIRPVLYNERRTHEDVPNTIPSDDESDASSDDVDSPIATSSGAQNGSQSTHLHQIENYSANGESGMSSDDAASPIATSSNAENGLQSTIMQQTGNSTAMDDTPSNNSYGEGGSHSMNVVPNENDGENNNVSSNHPIERESPSTSNIANGISGSVNDVVNTNVTDEVLSNDTVEIDVSMFGNIFADADETVPPVEVKKEDKTALRQLLEDNLNGEIPFIDLTIDPEEQAAIVAVENNLDLDDSDDGEDFLDGVVVMPSTVKFDFDTKDVLSGDMPFQTSVSMSRTIICICICVHDFNYVSIFIGSRQNLP